MQLEENVGLLMPMLSDVDFRVAAVLSGHAARFKNIDHFTSGDLFEQLEQLLNRSQNTLRLSLVWDGWYSASTRPK